MWSMERPPRSPLLFPLTETLSLCLKKHAVRTRFRTQYIGGVDPKSGKTVKNSLKDAFFRLEEAKSQREKWIKREHIWAHYEQDRNRSGNSPGGEMQTG